MYYNDPYAPPPVYEKFIPYEQWTAEKRRIRRLANIDGAAIILFVVLSELVALAVGVFTGLSAGIDGFKALWNSADIQNVVNMFYSVLVVGGSFLLVWILNRSDPSARLPFDAPKGAGRTALVVVGAIGACLAANIVTSYIDVFVFQSWGSDFYESIVPSAPDTPLGTVIYFVAIGILPPMIEEFALRGCVMQPLRRYGDMLAIVASAAVFAALHSSPIQIVFAFIAGIILGYAVVVTDSLWTGIVIHCVNNCVSVLGSIVTDSFGEESTQNVVFMGFYYALIGAGAVAVVFWFAGKRAPKLTKYGLINRGKGHYGLTPPGSAVVTKGSVYKAFFSAPVMIISYFFIAYKLFETFATVSLLT